MGPEHLPQPGDGLAGEFVGACLVDPALLRFLDLFCGAKFANHWKTTLFTFFDYFLGDLRQNWFQLL